MLTLFNWPVTIFIALITLVIIWIIKQIFLKSSWPKNLKTTDIAVFIAWWSIATTTFEVWHITLLVPMFLMFVIWGIALALYQGFIREEFSTRRFWLIWWRISTLTSYIILIGIAIYAYIVTSGR